MIETTVESLNQRLIRRIHDEGPITFAAWMRAALYDPAEGYYCRGDLSKWGRTGDYRTSPERSELFAATFARYFAHLYEELGRPSFWTILEAGPGGGHFARGVLTTLDRFFPEVFAATRYVIDEVGPGSLESCKQMTKEFSDRVEFGKLTEVQINPGVIFSNELLDAFPVHRVTVSGGVLRESFVTVDAEGNFAWTLDSPSTSKLQEYFDLCGIALTEGQVAEVSLEVEDWLKKIEASLQRGYVVTVDYGATAHDLYTQPERHLGTLRGFRRHSIANDVLTSPGTTDLTSTVNWTVVELMGHEMHLEVVDFKQQDKFLLDAGLLNQLEIASSLATSESETLRLSTSAREMILPDGMAAKFQVMVQKKS